ncbi:hypothetical protein NW752_001175 [Fusarium irregulare]|nr:hypothetical protein NW752_001175 [Fusarium irregulare]
MGVYHDSLRSDHVRLATIFLLPTPENADRNLPSVTLNTYEFEENAKPDYYALSYTWGKPRADVTDYTAESRPSIILNGQSFRVSPNLYDALFQLHQYFSDKPVWIDTLCINQDDIDERQCQVSAMDRVYGGADRVLIWLGEPTPHLMAGLKATERIAQVAERESKYIIKNQQFDFCYLMEDMESRYGLAPLTMEEIDGLLSLFQYRWFSRVWIIQEVSLAKEAEIFCGGFTISFDKIGYTAAFLHLSGVIGAIFSKLSGAGRDLHQMDWYHLYRAEKIQMLREWCKGTRSTWTDALALVDMTAGVDIENMRGSTGLISTILLKLLMWTTGFQATDARDSVYGLWGILQHVAKEQGVTVPKHLMPNYNIPASQVLESIATEILEATGDLTLLALVKDPARRVTADLPSWCPDFGPSTGMNSIFSPGFKSVTRPNASGTVKYGAIRQGKAFKVHGSLLGTVRLLGESFEKVTTSGVHGWVEILLAMDRMYAHAAQSSMEAFWRTLIWDHDFTNRPAKLVDRKGFKSLVIMWMAGAFQKTLAKDGLAAAEKQLEAYRILDDLASHIPDSAFPTHAEFKSLMTKLGLLDGSSEKVLSMSEQAAWIEKVRNTGKFCFAVIGVTSRYRRPFLTDNGHLGSSCESTQAGDKVWIVSGCPVPLVLRKSADHEEGYMLVGESYVHGVMNGEATEGSVAWQEIDLV